MNETENSCTFTGAFQSEGDGVHMKNYCVAHPDYIWYSETWPTGTELLEHKELHRAQLEFLDDQASDARGVSGD